MNSSSELELAPWPVDDFAAYGAVESVELSKRQRLTGAFLHRNWVRIPHVFHQDEANITALDELRAQLNKERGEEQDKLTILPFVIKAVTLALREYPRFNSSLNEDGNLVQKNYFHIGFAVDTLEGLLVPVIRDCDQKSVFEIASELNGLSSKATDKGLSMAEMSGGCFSVSSLGHVGGTGFTPIINAPQVAILGITRANWKPIAVGKDELEFQYRVPLSLSYDHRVINGVEAARFCACIADHLRQPEILLR